MSYFRLKNTYIYGYYLPDHVHRSIFEFLQGDLESGVERLSSLLETTGDKNRIQIINAAEYVKQRAKNLVTGLIENDIRGVGDTEERVYENSVEKYDGAIRPHLFPLLIARLGLQGWKVTSQIL